MELFQSIKKNKRQSWMLVFVLAVLATGAGFIIAYGFTNDPMVGVIGLVAAFVITLIMTLIAYFSGDIIMMALSGAREIKKGDNPQLFNVVEEMSIASGVPMPRVFIIDDPSPNAFATGRNPNKSAVAVTTGLLDRLKRDELQGVIAHEMSHIQNYDILFAMMVGILVGTIVMISDIAMRSLWFGGGRRRGGGGKGGGQAAAVFFIIALVFVILAPIFAMLLQFAISREREYLADAAGAKLTRYPEGLAGALEKIAYSGIPLEKGSKANQHMYIVNPFYPTKELSALFATHPPIKERIRRLRAM
jgi:heat shock protein HtpX